MNAQATSTPDASKAYHADQIYRTARTALRCGAAVWISSFAFETLRDFAGKVTDIDVAMSLLLNAFIETKFIVAIGLTGLAAAWAVVERILRHRTVEYMHDRVKKLEMQIDANRSSSSLTSAGKTNPSDLGV